MKAFLMYRDRDFDPRQPVPPNEGALTRDLELDTLFNAMALDDTFLFDVAKKVLLSGLDTDLDTIGYRQRILLDCLKNPAAVREVYAIAVGAIEAERKVYWGLLSRYPSAILHRSIEVLQMSVDKLKQLRQLADEHAARFDSEGFTTLFETLTKELGDDYFASVQEHLRRLKFRDGVLISAELGKGNKGAYYRLRKPHERKLSWMERFFGPKPPAYRFSLHPRDEGGARALGELRDRGINLVANALAQSTDHILSFFSMLRLELAFYVGCLNLHERLEQMEAPVCFPAPAAATRRRHAFRGLYDVCLALTVQQRVVGNDANADGKGLVVITGANRGGKSTFLRSVGLAQLMMQCGMFVPAEAFSSSACDRLFTHYKREEDTAMQSGKLDEELSRMSEIADRMTGKSLVLFNESFAATNQREGSEIARQIICALLEQGVRVFFVTHLYPCAHHFHAANPDNALFLRAERCAVGRRTFKLVEGEPLETSYGEDLYKAILGTDRSGGEGVKLAPEPRFSA